MSIEQETQYHRSFLSQNYTDNFADYLKTAGSVGYAVRQDREVQEIRDGDPDGFEAARKALAALLKVPYQPTVSGSYSGDRGGGYYREGNPPDAKVAEYLKPTYPPQSAVTNPATGNVALPNLLLGRVAAFRKGATLLRTTMFYKLDQEFENHASPWEKAFSTLIAPYHGGYAPAQAWLPIVDESWQVVGHYGTIQGGRGCGLLVPAGTKQKMKDFILGGADIQDFIDKGVPLQVWPRGNVADGHVPVPGWESGDFGVSDFTYGVRTRPDGRVKSVALVGNRDGVEDTWQLADFYFVGKALLDLPKLGRVLVKALGVGAKDAATNVSERVLQGATKEAAENANRQLDEEITTTTRDAESRARTFAKTTETGAPGLPKGEGYTTKYGDIYYSTQGTADDINLVRNHERVHSFLSPKLTLLREFRANLGMAAYKRIKLLKYLEEAMSETYAQVKVYGLKGLPTGIAFPVKEGYVTLRQLATEGAIGTIAVAGTVYGVHYLANK